MAKTIQQLIDEAIATEKAIPRNGQANSTLAYLADAIVARYGIARMRSKAIL